MKVTGIIVENKQVGNIDKVRVKLLGLPGEDGPEMIMARQTAIDLAKMIIEFMETGIDQDLDYVRMETTK